MIKKQYCLAKHRPLLWATEFKVNIHLIMSLFIVKFFYGVLRHILCNIIIYYIIVYNKISIFSKDNLIGIFKKFCIARFLHFLNYPEINLNHTLLHEINTSLISYLYTNKQDWNYYYIFTYLV